MIDYFSFFFFFTFTTNVESQKLRENFSFEHLCNAKNLELFKYGLREVNWKDSKNFRHINVFLIFHLFYDKSISKLKLKSKQKMI